MHPLRFPNSGIRAKVFVRKIGFKQRVMRLNRVESFYAFAARTAGKRGGQPWLAPMQGRPHTARPAAAKAPYKGATGHGQNPLAGAVASRCDRPWAWLAPVWATPAGVGRARAQAAGGGCPQQGRKGYSYSL
ncbi:hypothetical protein BHM03_00063023 [Ensete ventricosum]|nr:hypothetical protein BHM03_00063023 [Ensete ventricosum]